MWGVARELAAHATNADGGNGASGGGGSEESSSFKQQIEIPLAVSVFVVRPGLSAVRVSLRCKYLLLPRVIVFVAVTR